MQAAGPNLGIDTHLPYRAFFCFVLRGVGGGSKWLSVCLQLARVFGSKVAELSLFLVDMVRGNESIGKYLSVHKDSFSNPPTHRRLEEAVVGDWPKMMKFKAL
ncbi:hypothetical protein AVEN_107447-1 [Araneus ventricosus]|uniref:Uncharacterized protein n=1 Tax=Araneus ventricosus TaxID=182803 RepID=A0A4Y2FH38_ARAVE|nr:hypothetical protein AVEN_107447-1 [Araneus ventricosus]